MVDSFFSNRSKVKELRLGFYENWSKKKGFYFGLTHTAEILHTHQENRALSFHQFLFEIVDSFSCKRSKVKELRLRFYKNWNKKIRFLLRLDASSWNFAHASRELRFIFSPICIQNGWLVFLEHIESQGA